MKKIWLIPLPMTGNDMIARRMRERREDQERVRREEDWDEVADRIASVLTWVGAIGVGVLALAYIPWPYLTGFGVGYWLARLLPR